MRYLLESMEVRNSPDTLAGIAFESLVIKIISLLKAHRTRNSRGPMIRLSSANDKKARETL
jgi:hypothetical protein